MEAAARRQAILDRLRTADRPVSASSLAAELNVSRQIIVGDIALLRAGGAEISATPRGYVLLMYKNVPLGFVKNIGNRANNLYPQEWRIRSGYLPEEILVLQHQDE